MRREEYFAGPADVWALGVTFGVLLTGRSPFPSKKDAALGAMHLRRPIPDDAMDLLLMCCDVNQGTRASIFAIADHPFLSEPTIPRSIPSSGWEEAEAPKKSRS